MLNEEAIALISKQRAMYIIQDQNIKPARKYSIENKVKEQLRKEIQVRDYILRILKEQKK